VRALAALALALGLAARILGESIDFTRQGQLAVPDARPR
jgi:hypothetical protein